MRKTEEIKDPAFPHFKEEDTEISNQFVQAFSFCNFDSLLLACSTEQYTNTPNSA